MTIQRPQLKFPFTGQTVPGDVIRDQVVETHRAIDQVIDQLDRPPAPHSIPFSALAPETLRGIADEIAAKSLREINDARLALAAAASDVLLANEAAARASQAAARAEQAARVILEGSGAALTQIHAQITQATQRLEAAQQSALDVSQQSSAVMLSASAAENWSVASWHWAEYMGGPGDETLPADTVAMFDLTGDHWSARWWANKAAEYASGADGSNGEAGEAGAAAEAALDEFQTWYLGAFSVPPVLDGDGDPIVEGALYFDTVVDQMQVWDGTQWLAFVHDGVQGPMGPQGIQGEQGDVGPMGPQGIPGEQGDAGPAGPAGADSIVQGPQGIPGEPGATGLDGPVGPAGPAGADGADGADGLAGADGAPGATGPAGPQGEAGEVEEAPIDGGQYVRKDGVWELVDVSGGGGTGTVTIINSGSFF